MAHFSLSPCNLFCDENQTSLTTEYKTSNPCFFSEKNEDEFIQKLITKETIYGFSGDFFTAGCRRSWLHSARLDAIEWILRNQVTFGFHLRTAYLSVSYFDRFLSKRFIEDGQLWAVRLLSVACLTLAAKMEEYTVPALSEFAINEYFNFENKVIQKMELLVLSTLEWKMDSITPFHYMDYFISKFSHQSTNLDLVSTVSQLILNMAKEINLMVYRPSIITITAVLVAINGRLTRQMVEMNMSTISSCSSLEIEHIMNCFNHLKEVEMGKIKTPKLEGFQNLSNGFAGSKRNFPYNGFDQNFPGLKETPTKAISEFDLFCKF